MIKKTQLDSDHAYYIICYRTCTVSGTVVERRSVNAILPYFKELDWGGGVYYAMYSFYNIIDYFREICMVQQ
jgi:hypothetical protein